MTFRWCMIAVDSRSEWSTTAAIEARATEAMPRVSQATVIIFENRRSGWELCGEVRASPDFCDPSGSGAPHRAAPEPSLNTLSDGSVVSPNIRSESWLTILGEIQRLHETL